MAKRNLKKRKILELSCFEELIGSLLWVKRGFFCMLILLSLKCSGFWSFSVYQKLGFGPVSAIRQNTAPDSANMDMREISIFHRNLKKRKKERKKERKKGRKKERKR